MGFRFRKSVKIAPGVRLNLGKKGGSISIGGRGGRVTFGNGRTTSTIGLPGTGLSYSTTASSKRRSSGPTKKEIAEANLIEAEMRIEREISAYSDFLKIANNSEELKSPEDFEQELEVQDFTPELYGAKVRSRLFFVGQMLKKFSWWPLAASIAFTIISLLLEWPVNVVAFGSAGLTYCFLLQFPFLLAYGIYKSKERKLINDEKIEDLKSKHPNEEKNRIDHLLTLHEGQLDRLEDEVESALVDFGGYIESLAHKFELNTSFEAKAKDSILVMTDLPEIEDVVLTEIKKALKSGEVSTKTKKEKEQYREYATGVIGIAFHLASKILNVSPSIQFVTICAYTQRLDKSVGKIRDHYIYEIVFSRESMEKINLEAIDPLESVSLFPSKLRLGKDYYLDEIEYKEPA